MEQIYFPLKISNPVKETLEPSERREGERRGGILGAKESRASECLGFSFCFIPPGLGAEEDDTLKMLISTDVKSPRRPGMDSPARETTFGQ